MEKLSRLVFLVLAICALFSATASQAFADSLLISDVSVTPSTNDFTVQWTTNGDSSSQVLYGSTSTYDNQTTEIDTSPRVTSHSVTVSGLQSCTLYHFQAKSISLTYADTVAVSADQAVTTAGCADAATTTDATPTAEPLAPTGDSPALYFVALSSIFAIIFSISKLRGN